MMLFERRFFSVLIGSMVCLGCSPKQQPTKVHKEDIPILPSPIANTYVIGDAKPKDISDALAEYKAIRVANNFPTDIIIGCDQILVCNNEIISKARTLNEAKETLKLLRGKSHQLLSSAVIYDNNKPVWRTTSRAQLFMRDFTDEYLEYYIQTSGTDILSSVGCYLLENNGVNLFNRIQGDYFTVLGFPLLEVLDFLRKRELIKT